MNLQPEACYRAVASRLYPAASMVPFLELFDDAGVQLVFWPIADSGHDLRWWESRVDEIDSFIEAHPRNPLPDRIVWQTERTDRYHHAHRVVIEKLGAVDGEARLDDVNSVTRSAQPSLGLQPDPESRRGVRVLEIRSGSVAEAAGLERDDLVLEVDGVPTRTLQQLSQVLRDAWWGSVLHVVFERDGQRMSSTLRVPTKPPEQPPVQVCPRERRSGRIEVERRDNTILVRSEGVRRYRLLLSPERLNFDRPLTVITNGRESFRGRVERDVETLLEWAARDNDRTQLFGAALEIEVDDGRKPDVGCSPCGPNRARQPPAPALLYRR